MLAGCSSSSTLISPRHRLRSEAPQQFQACHFPMSAQRLDLPCTASFSRKDAQPLRPAVAGLSVEKPAFRLPPLATTGPPSASEARKREALTPIIGDDYWDDHDDDEEDDDISNKGLKRFADEDVDGDESKRLFFNRAKRKREDGEEEEEEEEEDFGAGNFWLNPQIQFALTCSGSEEEGEEEEEQQRRFPFASVVTEITETDGADVAAAFSSAASSASSGRTAPPLGDAENGSQNPGPDDGGGEGFELVAHLSSCLEAIGSRSVHGFNHHIARLGSLASPFAASPLSRVMAYYTEALALRVTRLWPHVFHVSPPRDFDRLDDDESTALRFLNQTTPIPKFIHFTANEMLLRAFEGKDRVHVIDFDIKQGLQWPSFLQSLASRPNPPSHVRITGVGESKQELNDAGDRLAGFAGALSLPFSFHAVVDRLEDVRLWMLHVKSGEAVAVNCLLQLHRTLAGGPAALRDFLGVVKSAGPAAVVVAEQEAEQDIDTSSLDARVCNSLRRYAALFDCVAASGVSPASAARERAEAVIFGREIRSVVACEGVERVERHVGFATWRRMLTEQGLRGIGGPGVAQGRMLLKMYGEEEEGFYGVTEREDGVGVTLTWRDQPLFTVSAWTTPFEQSVVAGSSSV